MTLALLALLQAERPVREPLRIPRPPVVERDLSTVTRSLLYLARHQAEDGGWGPRPDACRCPNPQDRVPDWPGNAELTGLALLSILGAGHSHLSREPYEGVDFGAVVRKGLNKLLSIQKSTARFDPEDVVGDAVATLALCEALGITGAGSLKEPAQAAVDRLVDTPQAETRGLIWKAMALKSAEITELSLPRKAPVENLEQLAARRGDLAIAGTALASMFTLRRPKDPRLQDLRRLKAVELEPEALHFAQTAIYQFDGPSGEVWKAWRGPVYRLIIPAQQPGRDRCEGGSWDGDGHRARLQRTVLCTLMFQYSSHYGPSPWAELDPWGHPKEPPPP